ncbi:hypothetical protein LPJ56_004489, partial [Coemansia sp. RSA 2599]
MPKRYVPSLEHGIEGYRFYMLKLEEMREMKIPNVTMQDLIQLNAAIYRLNVACASPANRSHMTGTLRTPTLNTPPLPPPAQQLKQQQHPPPPRTAKSATDSAIHTAPTAQYSLPPGSSQILSRPLQPLRPPRPSWTLRRDDPQPTYVRQQVQLTSNGMVARPVRVRPQDQSQLHRSPQPTPNASPPAPVPFSINTSGAIPVPHPHHGHHQQQQQQKQLAHQAARNSGPSPHSPYHENVVQPGERVQRFNASGAPTLVHHPEVEDLHALRSSQSAWSSSTPATVHQQQPQPQQKQQQQQQPQQRPPGIHVLPQQPTHYIVQRIPHITSSSMTVPVRYHGASQPYAFYYTHGASAPVNAAYVFHGAGNAPNTVRLASRPYNPADDAMYGSAGNRYNQQHSSQRPLFTTQYQTRPGIQGMFAESSSPEPPRSLPSRDSLAARPPRKNGSSSVRRASLSPVLTALKPGNYHIANLPDVALDDSSDTSDSSTDSQLGKRSQMMPAVHTRRAQQQQSQTLPLKSQLSSRPGLPAAINTSLLHGDLRHGGVQCDTGDSTITPLSVVNVIPGLQRLAPTDFGFASNDAQQLDDGSK